MGDITTIDLIVFGAIAFIGSILSGISGAGAGFINTPLLIFLGLSPAQAISSGKLTGLAISIGALSGMKGIKIRSRRTVVIIMIMALIIGLLAPLVIVSLESDFYRDALGIILVALSPVLLLKKVGHKSQTVSRRKKTLGFGVVGFALSLQGVFSGGLGTFVNVALMSFLGMSAMEANVTKRISQVVLNTTIVAGVFYTGLIMWPVALVGIGSSLLGGFIGGKIAYTRGDEFVMKFMVGIMFLSGLYLLFGN